MSVVVSPSIWPYCSFRICYCALEAAPFVPICLQNPCASHPLHLATYHCCNHLHRRTQSMAQWYIAAILLPSLQQRNSGFTYLPAQTAGDVWHWNSSASRLQQPAQRYWATRYLRSCAIRASLLAMLELCWLVSSEAACVSSWRYFL